MNFRIVTGKALNTFDVQVDVGFGYTVTHRGLLTEFEAREVIRVMIEEFKDKTLWQPGQIVAEIKGDE